MRIAVLSHNTIRKDARIIKEIQTLEREFPNMTAFGLKQRGEQDGNTNYPFQTTVVLIERRLRAFGLKQRSEPAGSGHYPFQTPVILTERCLSQSEADAILNGWPRFLNHRRLSRFGAAFAVIGSIAAFASLFGQVPPIVPLLLLFTALGFIDTSRRMRRKPKKTTTQRQNRSVQDAATLSLSPKNGEIVCIAKARSALFKQSYHLVGAVGAEALSGGPFQVIHAHDLAGLDAGVRIKKKNGGVLIWDAHEIYEDLANPDPVNAAYARRVIEDAAPWVDHFITINDGLAEFYRTHYPKLPDPVILMNATIRATPPQDDGRLRNVLGAREDQRILLFQGGFSMHRGLTKLVRAARDMPEDWILAMMGEGHLRDELIEIADGINAEIGEARVRFIPSVPQAELIYWTAGATLGAIPYENVAANHWFCTPNKLWEYPAAGVPFIAPRLHEISRVVDEYGTGFLFPAEFDAKTISDLITTLDGAALAEKRANIARFIEECSWEVFAPRLTELYREIAEDLAASKVIPFEPQAVAAPPITARDRKAS